MRKFIPFLFLAAAFFVSGNFLLAQDTSQPGVPAPEETRWFRSNPSGIALEPVFSRLAALRNEYSLSVESAEFSELPEILVPYYGNFPRIELRVLYENGAEIRRQWIFRDADGSPRLSSSGSAGLFGGASGEEPKTGFIELRNSEGSLEKEIRFEEDLSEWEFQFAYNGGILLSADTGFKKPGEPGFVQVSTDYYRYSRFGSLRAIDRVLHEGANQSRLFFPRIGPDTGPGNELSTTDIAYSSEFLSNIHSPEGVKIQYTLDSRGRILTELWKDEEGATLGEYRNTWSGEKLMSVLWKSADDERLVEYEYDNAGNRAVERNFRRGELERTITVRGAGEIEEIYMDGKLMLRAFWENGIKISEERISGRGGNIR